MLERLSYAVITPARDEAANLPHLAAALAAQTAQPTQWIIVDDGSRDRTTATVEELARAHPFVQLVRLERESGVVRGGFVVDAFEHGLPFLREAPDIVVKLDADTTFEPGYFERLTEHFAADPSLGIASGTCLERTPEGVWQERRVTGANAWGATRAYRRECLSVVVPLERAMGWDGIDAAKAALSGYRTAVLEDIAFRHHRREGERDGRRTAAWRAQGRASYYMAYRFPFLVLRALHHARHEPSALSLVTGYLAAAIRREPQVRDLAVRAHIRDAQRLRALGKRIRQATRAVAQAEA